MRKILSTIALLSLVGTQLAAWQSQPPGAEPPAPIVLLNAGEHLLCGKSRDGKIEMQDGTQFKALSAESMKVYEEWDYHDHLSITRNTLPMGGSEYYITNLDKGGEFVHANFLSEPYKGGPYTQFINHIDPFDGEVSIFNNNGNEFCWKIDEKDLLLLEGWEENDRILIGKNDLWIERMRSDCEFVMVNVDKNYLTHLRVSPISNNH